MSQAKEFHLGDVLTVTTGKLLSPRHMAGVYEILDWMTGDQLFTHQLPRAADECKPALLAQYPQLAEIDASGVTPDNFKAWLDAKCAEYGETLAVRRLPDHVHEFIDPISELAEKVHPDRIIPIVIGT